MLSSEARKQVNLEIPLILKDAGLFEGETLDNDEIVSKTDKRIYFWQDRVDEIVAKSKSLFVVWQQVSISAIAKADDRVAARRSYVSISIYSKFKSPNLKIEKLINDINTAFENYRWDFESISAATFDETTMLWQFPFSAIRIIK